MPVSGEELATLDFSNLIGGPMNAMVEAQAKAAISTASFIQEVGFDEATGAVRTVDFTYTRADEDGARQNFTLTVPFLTMVPIPYVTLEKGTIDFNAKITSTTYEETEVNFTQDVDTTSKAGWWFASARVTTKTAYQKRSASSDLEERTFDMKVHVTVRNMDMPAGTERLLTLLENSISEVKDGALDPNDTRAIRGLPTKTGTTTVTEMVMDGDVSKTLIDSKVSIGGVNYAVVGIDPAHNKLLLKPLVR
jgi:hypothetical protein